MTDQEALKVMKDWALANYEKGGDIFIECYEDSELLEMFHQQKTVEGTLGNMKNEADLYIEQRNNTKFGDGVY